LHISNMHACLCYYPCNAHGRKAQSAADAFCMVQCCLRPYSCSRKGQAPSLAHLSTT
jgi:hypothetical protein